MNREMTEQARNARECKWKPKKGEEYTGIPANSLECLEAHGNRRERDLVVRKGKGKPDQEVGSPRGRGKREQGRRAGRGHGE